MKKIWLKIKAFWYVVFGGEKKLEQFLKDHSADAVDIVETLKSFVESDVLITLISAFPKYADKAKAFLDAVDLILDDILKGIVLGAGCLDKPTELERLVCAIAVLKSQPNDARNNSYRDIAAQYLIVKSAAYTANQQAIPKSMANSMVENQIQRNIAEATLTV